MKIYITCNDNDMMTFTTFHSLFHWGEKRAGNISSLWLCDLQMSVA
jgi:hypothetical protein